MRNKTKLVFSDSEKIVIIKSLNLLRNYFSLQKHDTIFIDELMLKINDSHKVKVDKYEAGTIINALNLFRYKLKSQNESRIEVNDILKKLIDETTKTKLLVRNTVKCNDR